MEKKILPFIISLASGGSIHQFRPGRAPSGLARPTSEQGLRHRAPAWWHGRPPPGASAAEIRQGPARPNSGRGGTGDLRQGRYMGELHQGWHGRPPSGAARLIFVQGDLGQAAARATSVRRRRPSSAGGGAGDLPLGWKGRAPKRVAGGGEGLARGMEGGRRRSCWVRGDI
jgi:hypothetical protein